MVFKKELGGEGAERDTRQGILDLLKMADMDVNELSEKLGVSPTGTRQHLMILEKAGLIKPIPVKSAVGRPKYIYSLTEKSEGLFPKAYDDFLEWLIQEIVDWEGEKKAKELFQRIAKKRAAMLKDQFAGKSLEDRVQLLTGLLDESGCYAECSRSGDAYTIREYNCVLKKLVGRHGPIVCAHERTFLEALLGEKVKVIDTMGQGARYCTFEIRSSTKA